MSDTEAPPSRDPLAMSHRQILEAMTGLLAALFTALLSTTIVANALPTIIGDLQGSQTAYAWVITTALLTNAASTPIWGKLADLFNKKTLVQSAIVIFVIGSVIAGLSHNVALLLVARALQGIGMGGLTALVQAIIGSIIPPRERGRYSGYMGAVMAVSMTGGPILGGVIVDSPLGWRWCFYICVPLALIALFLLQRTLKLPTTRKENVSIDWLGATLLTAGVSVLLIWVSFAGKAGYYDWWSTESALYVGGGVLLLIATVLVEAKVKDPVIPLKIVTERTTALAILASIAVGVGMFGATTFLGQYLQTARGYSPTAAGLLSSPMVAGMLVASVTSGLLITRFGKWKPFVVAGAALLVIGFSLLSTVDHATNIWLIGAFITVTGMGVGMMMQNLVLAVQNTVSVQNIGAASSSVAFFRTFGGAIGVSVLGSVLATRVGELSSARFAELGIHTDSSGGSNLDLGALPAPIAEIVRFAYGDATGRIFLIAAFATAVALLAALLLPNRPLRRTIDIEPTVDPATATDMAAKTEIPDDIAELDTAAYAVTEPAARDTGYAEDEAPRTDRVPVAVGAPAGPVPADRNGHGGYSAAGLAKTLPVAGYSEGGSGRSAVEGRIRREDGRPVPGVALTLIDQRGQQVARTIGTSDGGFSIDAPGPGNYVLIASATGHGPTAVNVAVADRTVRTDLTLTGLGELSGTVRRAPAGEPLAGATVTVTDQRGEVVASATSDGTGSYLCHGVVPGTYTLVAVAEHMRPSATALTVPDSGLLRHDIELAPMAVLTGSARSASGRTLEDIQITVLDAAGEVNATVRTDENGRYVVTDLPEGQYTVVARGYPPITGQVAVTGAQADFDVRLGYDTEEHS
ncbi:MFS transporter [Nocardia flavorosea]|uniref:alpha-amylase n=1 Tax=Nocardia flavorosea TaxID=53429 RepID=A0A846YDM6_9NOCA|nr:MFS transporter [Nocardia flavorosea]